MSLKLNMASGIREFAGSSPHRVAAVEGDRSLTFAGMDDRSSRLAQGLLALGCGPEKPVAVLWGNCLEYFEIVTAMAKAGVPVVPLRSRNSSPSSTARRTWSSPEASPSSRVRSKR